MLRRHHSRRSSISCSANCCLRDRYPALSLATRPRVNSTIPVEVWKQSAGLNDHARTHIDPYTLEELRAGLKEGLRDVPENAIACSTPQEQVSSWISWPCGQLVPNLEKSAERPNVGWVRIGVCVGVHAAGRINRRSSDTAIC